jgi:hypothetical protein
MYSKKRKIATTRMQRVQYDYLQKYHTKCEPIKCHGKLSYQCESKICSNNKTECNYYNYSGNNDFEPGAVSC